MANVKREFRTPAKRAKHNEKGIMPGTYTAKIIAVGTPDGFADDDDSAMYVRYEIEVEGRKVEKDENFFFGDFENPRVERLNAFLRAEGCKSYDDAIGKPVLLTFVYEAKHGRKYCNIVRYASVDKVDEQAEEAC